MKIQRLSIAFVTTTALLFSSVAPASAAAGAATNTKAEGGRRKDEISAVIGIDGAAEIVQGATKSIKVRVTNGNPETVRGLGARVVVPKGLSVKGGAPKWACAPSSPQRITCRYSGELLPADSTTISLSVTAADDAQAGDATILVAPFAAKMPAPEKDRHTIHIVDRGDARIVPVVKYVASRGVASAAVKSTATLHNARVNQPYTFTTTLQNKGFETLRRGTKVTVQQSVGSGVRINSVKSSSGAKCTVESKKWTCDTTPKNDVRIGSNLDRITVVVTPTVESKRMNLNPITVSTAGIKDVETVAVRVMALAAQDTVRIHVKDLYRAHENGTSAVQVQFENIGTDTLPAGHVVSIDLPDGVTYVSGSGKSWKCSASNGGNNVACAFSSTVASKKFSTELNLVSKLSKSVVASDEGYIMEIKSPNGWTSHHITVEAAPTNAARAGYTRSADGGYTIGLTGEILASNKRAYESQWVQRCTTPADAKSKVCPSNKVVPALTISGATEQDATAIVPVGTDAHDYTFEYRAVTKSMNVAKIVKVRIPSTAGVSASDVSAMAVTPPTIPSDIINAFAATGVIATGAASVSTTNPSLITQPAVFATNIARQFAMLGTNLSIMYNSATDTTSTCAKALLDTSAAPGLGNNFSVTNFYAVAPRSGTCSYNGNTVTKGGISFNLNLFGNSIALYSPIDPTASFGTLNVVTQVASIDYPMANDTFKFKNVTLTVQFDVALKMVTVLLGVNVSLLGTTFTLGGAVKLDWQNKSLSGDLVMAQPTSVTIGGVTFSNFSYGMGITYQAGPGFGLNVMGSGAVSFLGQSLNLREFQAVFVGEDIVSLSIDFGMVDAVPGAYKLNGDFTVNWHQPRPSNPNDSPLQVTGMIQFNADGFQIGTTADPAQFMWQSNCFYVSGGVSIPGVLSADVSGYMVTQPTGPACSSYSKTFGVGGIFGLVGTPANPGDYRFDAQNVKFNPGGLDASGNFTFGKLGGIPYGMVDVTTKLTTHSVNASVHVNGAVSPLTGYSLVGNANLDIAGYTVAATVTEVLTPKQQTYGLSGSLNISGVNVAFAGQVTNQAVNGIPTPAITMSGSAQMKIDSYDLGNATFNLSETPTNVGLSATSNIDWGPVKAGATLGFYKVAGNKIAFKIATNGQIKWDSTGFDVDLQVSNCNNWDNCTDTKTTYMNANGSVELSGRKFNFGWFPINPDKSFYVSASDSGRETLLPHDAKVLFDWAYTAVVSSNAPYVHLDTDLRARGYLRWDKKWYKEVDTTDGITLNLDPFYLSVHFCIKDIGCDTFKIEDKSLNLDDGDD